MSTIPCSVGILTRNSAATLAQALESVREFDDIIVCDGGSTDGTLDIARRFGATVVAQEREFLDEEGRVADYAGVRNQTLRLARHEWFFFLDSDEYITPELAREIAMAVRGQARAYWVPRRYTWGGKRIACSTTYPNRQMRLFNKRTARAFIRRVHERIELAPGAQVAVLLHDMIVPLDTTPEALWRKWDRYIALGERGGAPISFWRAAYLSWRHVRPSVLFALRHVRMLVLCRGTKLPLWRELAEHAYNYKVIASLWRAYRNTP